MDDGKFLTLLNKILYSKTLNILFGFETKHAFDFDLNWQAVHVPAWTLEDITVIHGVITENGIFNDLVPGSSKVDVSGRIRGSVNKKKPFSSFAVFPGFSVCIAIFPELRYLFFDLLCVILGSDFFYHNWESP